MNYVDLNFILRKEKCLKQSQDVAPVIFALHNHSIYYVRIFIL